MDACGTQQNTPVTPQMPALSAAVGQPFQQQPLASVSAAPSPTSAAASPPVVPGSAGLPVQSAQGARALQPSDPTVFQLTDRQVRGGAATDDVPLYVMCRLWVQNCIDADCGPRTNQQEDNTVRLPPPLPPSKEAFKDPPKEVALLQDEETLFLDEDTLPAELLMEHHKEHWVAVRGWHQANIQRELKRWERRLGTLVPAYPAVGLPSPPATMAFATHLAASSGQ